MFHIVVNFKIAKTFGLSTDGQTTQAIGQSLIDKMIELKTNQPWKCLAGCTLLLQEGKRLTLSQMVSFTEGVKLGRKPLPVPLLCGIDWGLLC